MRFSKASSTPVFNLDVVYHRNLIDAPVGGGDGDLKLDYPEHVTKQDNC